MRTIARAVCPMYGRIEEILSPNWQPAQGRSQTKHIAELQAISCADCLEQRVICQEDLNDISLLQRKTQVPDKPDPARTNGQQHLPRFTARCLSHQSLLHISYRTIEDHEDLVIERHKYNIRTIDGKIKQIEYVQS